MELAWDSVLLKKKIGRLSQVPSEKNLRKLIQKAYSDGYDYLSCRIIAEKMSHLQLLEKNGFYMTDIGAVWEKKIEKIQGPAVPVKSATKEDISELKSMVKGLFKCSRFYNDPFFTDKEAEKIYETWIENALPSKKCGIFLVEEKGFITCKKLFKKKGDIALIGVIPGEQDKGIGYSLICKAFEWFHEMGVDTVTVRTQATNIKAMNFYRRLNFKLKYLDCTMGMILKNKE